MQLTTFLCSFYLPSLSDNTCWGEDVSYDRYQKPIGTLDIRLRKIVLASFHDRKSHINLAKFFVMNASMLESVTLQLKHGSVDNDAWIRRHHMLLQIENRASRGA
jgi:hypothetical protein